MSNNRRSARYWHNLTVSLMLAPVGSILVAALLDPRTRMGALVVVWFAAWVAGIFYCAARTERARAEEHAARSTPNEAQDA